MEDANDCYPVIEKENYNITLPENLFIGSQILKITASDCDIGANAVLSYFIESINGEINSELFYIELAEGTLYLKHQLNYEECKEYLLVISVNDHGTPSLRSRANIWITGKIKRIILTSTLNIMFIISLKLIKFTKTLIL